MRYLPLITAENDLAGKRILLRLDLNVPLLNGEVRDAYRIEQSIPTIDFLRKAGARVIIMSHLGSGKPEDTLFPIAKYLNQKFPVKFLDRLMSPENGDVIHSMHDSDVILLENLRHNNGEEKNDPKFARYLASLGDVYVNDAFAVSHRAHASLVGVPALLPSFAGILFAQEVEHLAVAFAPKHPFLFILGGAKISTKMPLLKKFLTLADHVFLGGTIANNFLKAAGHEIGRSVYEKTALDGLPALLADKRLVLPSDVVIKNSDRSEARSIEDVSPNDMIVDIGGKTIKNLERLVREAKLIVWNGPLGYYEEGFTGGTRGLFLLVADSKATSIVGGGDTAALVNEVGFLDRFSFVSTGGGAMLDFLLNETLPGIEALKKK